MSEFNYKTVCILGRQPALGLAELERIYGPEHIRPIQGAALLDIEASEINFKRLGGVMKVARILSVLPTTGWPQLLKYLEDVIPEHLQYLPEGKFTLGMSVYGINVNVQAINRDMLKLKKIIRNAGKSVRIVPNKTLELNSAQVLHNKLTHRGAWELNFIADGNQTILAQTMFVQDIEAYGARDQARPHRDARVGMLPPKLAQIIVNLAKPPEGGTVLDPFCGTGVILQEALLMGFNVYGSDLEPRMVEYTEKNLKWLAHQYPNISGSVLLEMGDATSHQWSHPFDSVASEVYLGRPLAKVPAPADLKAIIGDVNTITKKFLRNIAGQLKKGQSLCVAVPAWQTAPNRFAHLPVIDRLTDMGYNQLDLKHVRSSDLIYFRENQVVARQLLILEKV
jgi:tRNA G10  N-methylase Trm11